MKPIEIHLEGRKVFVCSECKHTQNDAIQCKKCGAPSHAFDEKKEDIDLSQKGIYEVKENVLIQGYHVDKGNLVILPAHFYITQDLLTRKVIVLTKKTTSRVKGVRVLKRDVGTDIPNPHKKVFARLADGQALEIK